MYFNSFCVGVTDRGANGTTIFPNYCDMHFERLSKFPLIGLPGKSVGKAGRRAQFITVLRRKQIHPGSWWVDHPDDPKKRTSRVDFSARGIKFENRLDNLSCILLSNRMIPQMAILLHLFGL